MVKKAILLVFLLIPTVSAWEVKSIEYDTVNKTLTISYDLNLFEKIILLVLGGDYTKDITENLINGNYTIISAGYDQVKIRIDGWISFGEPTEILIKNGEVYYLINTTYLKPDLF